MNWLKLLTMISGCFTLAGTFLSGYVQDRKMSDAVKAEVEKALKAKK